MLEERSLKEHWRFKAIDITPEILINHIPLPLFPNLKQTPDTHIYYRNIIRVIPEHY